VIEHKRPDIIFVDKDNKRALLIDIAVPADARVEEMEQEKIDRYQDLARELKRLWKVETKVVGALGTVPKGLEKNLEKAGRPWARGVPRAPPPQPYKFGTVGNVGMSRLRK